MSKAADRRPATETEVERPSSGGIEELRDILVGPEREKIERLEERDLQAEEVGKVLPDAVLLRTREDTRLADSLRPTIEEAIEGSVQRNPRVLTDAIFPLMGPAIRKSIRQTLASLLEGINRSLEHSLSIRGLRWRLEARRTGKPFAEIVLKHSLVYRVDQVFLIHRETGLLLEHVLAPAVHASDPEMVSSMLGAIQDFVSDSFSGDGDGQIAQVEFGDFFLEVAQGPLALVVCVVRGIPRTALRTRMEEVVERIHAERGSELTAFDGDVDPFLLTRPLLESCLMEQRAERRRIRPGTVLVGAGIVVLSLIGVVWAVRSLQTSRDWAAAVEALQAEPGIVLLSSRSSDGAYHLRGMRDPLSRDPLEIVAGFGMDPQSVEARWEPYHSLESAFVLERARLALDAPESAQILAREDGLAVVGEAPHDWVERARDLAAGLPGVDRVDFGGLTDLDFEEARRLALEAERTRIVFPPGSAELDEQQAAVIELIGTLQALEAAAQRAEVAASIEIVGSASSNETNPGFLQQWRAEAVGRLLRRSTKGSVWIAAVAGGGGVGAADGSVSLRIRLVEDRLRARGE